MSGATRQIAELLKQGLGYTEVAEALGMTVDDVIKLAGPNNGEVGKELEESRRVQLDTELENLQEAAIRVMHDVMTNGERDRDRLRAAEYVVDHGLGLKKPKADIKVFAVVDFNKRLEQVKERRRQLEQGSIPVDATLEAAVA